MEIQYTESGRPIKPLLRNIYLESVDHCREEACQHCPLRVSDVDTVPYGNTAISMSSHECTCDDYRDCSAVSKHLADVMVDYGAAMDDYKHELKTNLRSEINGH